MSIEIAASAGGSASDRVGQPDTPTPQTPKLPVCDVILLFALQSNCPDARLDADCFLFSLLQTHRSNAGTTGKTFVATTQKARRLYVFKVLSRLQGNSQQRTKSKLIRGFRSHLY